MKSLYRARVAEVVITEQLSRRAITVKCSDAPASIDAKCLAHGLILAQIERDINSAGYAVTYVKLSGA